MSAEHTHIRTWTIRVVVLGALVGATMWVLGAGADLGAGAATEVPATLIVMPPEFLWTPARPTEGRLFTIRVVASAHTAIMGVHGRVGDEELHLRRIDARTFEGLAAVPVGAGATVPATFRVVYADGAEQTFREEVPVTPGVFAHERLTVAPRFGAPPDSADQAKLELDQAKAREVARIAHRTPRLSTGVVVMPRESRVTSGFGDGREFNGQISSRHMGLDLQGFRGDTVVAAARGVVALVDDFLLAGSLVYVNHGAGLVSAYFHLSEQQVVVGDTVEAGTPVGRVGATGRVTGPHLHWVVRYGGTSVDPRSLLDVAELTGPVAAPLR